MTMKCFLAPLVSAMAMVGLSACDEGRIVETHTPIEPATGEDLTLRQSVQRHIFDAHCIACHGGNGSAAAGLFLTEGRSLESLREQPSAVVEGATLLVPGDHAASLLYQTVASDVSVPWAFTHNNLLDDSEKYLLATWIDLE